MGAMANDLTAAYIGWEEVVVSSGRGRREFHYFLKRSGGGRDLVVVGKAKRDKGTGYDYSIKESNTLLPIMSRYSGLKLRARREVVDWLDSVLSGRQFSGSPWLCMRETESMLETDISPDVQMRMLDNHLPGFAWIGSSWTCLKKQRHYRSFCRNGAVISAHDFVYVLAEGSKRLIAHVEDMYEDTSGKKMAVVRWFHKIDEVGFVLTRTYNDREIFFSLCLQDISVECIDGIATVLSQEHYEKMSTEATRMGLIPFVCYRQFDSGSVKPFEVTSIQGYWKQEFLRKNVPLFEISDSMKSKGDMSHAVGQKPHKRIRSSNDCDPNLKFSNEKGIADTGMQLTVGSRIEVLSQDSGIKGCWFRAVIMKKHKNKVKVQYNDIKDADDDSKNLEEWVLPSRLAAKDVLGIRSFGRSIVRPTLLFEKGRVREMLNVGSIVDAWWHDGWWEGIVVNADSPEKLSVYFPGENQECIFSPGDLRLSKEWFENDWQDMKERPDIASKIPQIMRMFRAHAPANGIKIGKSSSTSDNKMPLEHEAVRDPSKNDLPWQLRWISSGKKRRARGPVRNVHFTTRSTCFETGDQAFGGQVFSQSPMKFDSENCKYASAGSTVVSHFSNLVMSR